MQFLGTVHKNALPNCINTSGTGERRKLCFVKCDDILNGCLISVLKLLGRYARIISFSPNGIFESDCGLGTVLTPQLPYHQTKDYINY